MKKLLAGMLSAIMMLSAVAASASEVYYAENRYMLKKQIYGNGALTEVVKTGSGAALVSEEGADVIEATVSGNFGGIAFAKPSDGWGFVDSKSCLAFEIKIVDRPNYIRVHLTGTPTGGYWGDYGILNQPVANYGKETADGYYAVKIPLSAFKLTPAQIDSLTNKMKIEAYDEMGSTSGRIYVRNIAIEQPVITTPEIKYTTKKEILTNLTDTIPDNVLGQGKSSPKPTPELVEGAIKVSSDQEFFGINITGGSWFTGENEYLSFKVKTSGRGTGMRILFRGYPKFNNYAWTEKGFSNIDITEYGTLGADGFYNVKIPVKAFSNTYEELSQLETLELSTRMNYDNIIAGDIYIKDVVVESSKLNPTYNVQKTLIDKGVASTSLSTKKETTAPTYEIDGDALKVTGVKQMFFGINIAKPSNGWFTSDDEYLCFDIKFEAQLGTKMRVFLNGFSSGKSERGLSTKNITPYAELGADGYYHVMLPLSVFSVSSYSEANQTSGLELSVSNAWADRAAGSFWIKNVTVEKLAGTKAELAVKNADETAEITTAAVGDTVVASVNYVNNLTSTINYVMLFASYDENGALVQCDVKPCAATTGNMDALKSTYVIPAGVASLKAMLWDTTNSMVSYTQTIDINVN